MKIESRQDFFRREKRLTKKQKKLAELRVKYPEAPLKELGQKSGYSDAPHTQRALKTPHVQACIQRLMSRHPETCPSGLHRKMVEGLNATETRFFADGGKVVDERTVIDYGTRHRYLETAAKWSGLSSEPGDGGQVISIGFLLLKNLADRGLGQIAERLITEDEPGGEPSA